MSSLKWATLKLLERVPELYNSSIFDPFGYKVDGHIIREAIREVYPSASLAGNDNPGARDVTTKLSWEHFPEIDWVVTEPIFTLSGITAEHALKYAKQGVALFMSLSFLEPTYDRQYWLENHPPSSILVLPRIYKDRSITNAWFIWIKHPDHNFGNIQIVRKP